MSTDGNGRPLCGSCGGLGYVEGDAPSPGSTAELLGGRRTHKIKSWPDSFEAALAGRKTFEIRIDDRGYETGDLVLLQEWRPPVEGAIGEFGYTRRQVLFLVGYVTRGPTIPHGWCGFELISIETALRVAAAIFSRRAP